MSHIKHVKHIKLVFYWITLLSLSLLFTCASGVRENQKKLREMVSSGRYEDGIKIVNDLVPLKQERSRLLHYMEKGLLYHLSGNYFVSAQYLQTADNISRDLYTKSLSSSALTTVANETVNVFYGEVYERSIIHFYLVLDYYLLSQYGKVAAHTKGDAFPMLTGSAAEEVIPEKSLSENERMEYLAKARAELLAWDSLLNTWRDERRGKSVFKDDMLAKVLGGLVHEAFGRFNDDQIALQLYKDAKELLFRNYNSYHTFNLKSENFKKDFDRLPNLDPDSVKSEYVTPTISQQELTNFLDYKILLLTQKIRPEDWNQVVRIQRPKEEIIKQVQSMKSGQRADKADKAVSFVLQVGLIAEKVGDKYNIGFEGLLNNIDDPKTKSAVAAVGVPVLSFFMANVLGLTPSRGNFSLPEAVVGLEISKLAVTNVGFEFELPKIQNPTAKSSIQFRSVIEIFKKSGELVQSVPLALVTPLSDIAEEAVAEGSALRYLKTGVRVGLKHLTAILAAYATYKALEPNSKFFAKSAAVIEYIGASKAIAATEKADVRYWATLPNEIRIAQTFLPPGEYEVKLRMDTINSGSNSSSGTSGKDKVDYYQLGFITVAANQSSQFFNYRINGPVL